MLFGVRLSELFQTLRFRLTAWITFVVAIMVIFTMLAVRGVVLPRLQDDFDHELIEDTKFITPAIKDFYPARPGQLIKDLHAGVYRWRQIMPFVLAPDDLGPGDPETAAARELVAGSKARVTRDERRPDGLRILEGQVPDRPVTALIDADGRMLRGKCTCSHHFSGGLRRGPCRHLQALRDAADAKTGPPSLDAWFAALAP